jgi:hypothetical protein
MLEYIFHTYAIIPIYQPSADAGYVLLKLKVSMGCLHLVPHPLPAEW